MSCGEDHAVAVAADDGAAVLGGEDVGDELRRGALRGLAAGEGAGDLHRAGQALGEGGEVEAVVELLGVAVGEGGEGLDGLVGGPVGDDAVADLGEGDERRRVDACRRGGWRGRRRRAR